MRFVTRAVGFLVLSILKYVGCLFIPILTVQRDHAGAVHCMELSAHENKSLGILNMDTNLLSNGMMGKHRWLVCFLRQQIHLKFIAAFCWQSGAAANLQ